MAAVSKAEVLHSVQAQRGPTLRCKGWKQETLLRLLENTMETAEHPERLIIYGGVSKCARNWESFHALVAALRELEDDETLVVQSGMPVAVFRTHDLAPRVVMANTNFVRASWPLFYELQEKNLTMFAGYSAAPWQYIGTQGVIHGTFETLRSASQVHFGGSLAGRLLLTAGMGGMGGNQPRAMTMLDGVAICADVDEQVIRRRMDVGYCDVIAMSLDEALSHARDALREARPLGIGLVGNAVEVLEEMLRRGELPDLITDMTPAHDPLMYMPAGLGPQEAEELRLRDRDAYLELARASMKRQMTAMLAFQQAGVAVFEYGNQLRRQCVEAGMEEALEIPNFVASYLRPLFLEGRGPFRWMCVSGEKSDLARMDELCLELFSDDPLVTRWIEIARDQMPIEGLPSRVCYLGLGQRAQLGVAANELVASGELAGPVAFSRDNLDSGSVINPTFETEHMPDGSDVISDWPYLNGLLNASAMCDLIAIQSNYGMGESVHTGVTMIADGTPVSALRLERCLTVDPGIGVVRHAQAGYDRAREVVEEQGVSVPLWWTPTATFGPESEA